MGMPIYRPCMANNLTGTKLGAASRGQNPNLRTGVIHGGRSVAPVLAILSEDLHRPFLAEIVTASPLSGHPLELLRPPSDRI